MLVTRGLVCDMILLVLNSMITSSHNIINNYCNIFILLCTFGHITHRVSQTDNSLAFINNSPVCNGGKGLTIVVSNHPLNNDKTILTSKVYYLLLSEKNRIPVWANV